MMRWLVALLMMLVASIAQATISLEGSTDSLEVVTGSAGSVDYYTRAANVTATALTTPVTSTGNITTATTTTVLAAPSASNWRHVQFLSLRNASTTASNAITVQVDRSAANRTVWAGTLAPGETVTFDNSGAVKIYTASGTERNLKFENVGFTGRTYTFGKVATVFDTVAYHYAYGKDTGFPGAWTPGTPGLNGATTNCDAAAGAVTAGSFVLPDASSAWYLTKFGLTSAVVGNFELIDVLWYNTGLVVTTTTGQAITFPGLPARDLNGSTNGEGVYAALYTTTANTNVAAIANTTLTYTDQDGNAGATATFSGTAGFQAPISPVVGTWMPFLLATGDRGIRSVQTVTLGTSYGAGALSLILYRPLAREGVATANTSSGSLTGQNAIGDNPGVRVYNDTCFWFTALGAPATTAAGIYNGQIQLMDR